ncbi:expressed unknown protein [Seminavis robusta]|uniref:Uncharacterized protein n=1 Tax=Seminavis robusta TaxID=568900 RepID=A0A9N8GZX7_9STRA|nr:expressed unknown protein [Seminavis robusta]|eukprot:Sro10_g008280.1 n/a (453) ;mRNA; f:186352-187854
MKKERSNSLVSSGGKSAKSAKSSKTTTKSSKIGKNDKSEKSVTTRTYDSDSSLSVNARWSRVEEGVELFDEFLKSSGSICLPADFRWAIALEARHCWTGCAGCQELNQGKTCERNGSAYSLLKSVTHTSSPDLPYSVTDRASWEKVRLLVHTAINHQARAEQHWYQSTIKSLSHTSIIPKHVYKSKNTPAASSSNSVASDSENSTDDQDRHKLLIATLFSEILATVMLSHVIHVVYKANGLQAPDLPPFQLIEQELENKDTLKCTYQDVATAGMMRKGKTVRWPTKDNKASHVPIIISKDIDVHSQAWQAFPKQTQEYLMANMLDMHPMSGLTLCPAYMALCGTIIGAKIGLPETIGATPWKTLEKKKYCTQGGFTRADWELGWSESTILQNVVTRLQNELGDATLLEGACALAYAEAYGKVTDLSGLQPIPKPFLYIMTKVIPVLKYFSKD